ncbi:hypothetical protein ACHQM5_011441 [Ranunculus cassubicifolius]
MATVPSTEELYNMLLNREKRLEVYHISAHTSTTSVLASNNRGFQNNRGSHNNRGRANSGKGNQARGRGNSNRGNQNRTNYGRGYGRDASNYGHSQGSHYIVVCQICFKPGHSALACNQYPSNNAPQPDDFPTAFFAMSMSTPPYEPTWFPDTGATNHMTADDFAFIDRQAYHGADQVTVANGNTLPISSTGSSYGKATPSRTE